MLFLILILIIIIINVVREHLSSPRFFGGVRVTHLFICCAVLLRDFTFQVPCCDIRYDFFIKTMFSSSLPPVVCRMAHALFTLYMYVFVCVQWCSTHCVVFLFCFSSSCVPCVVSFSRLSIFYCPFGIL